MKKLIFAILVAAMALTGMAFSSEEPVSAAEPQGTYEAVAVNSVKPVQETDILESISVKKAVAAEPMVEKEVVVEQEPEEPPAPSVTQEEIELIALCVMAEAEGECEYGQRLVIDTILNRVDDPHFPDTVHEVVYQKNQFSSMWNGRVDRCYVKEELVDLVKEELRNRTNYDVVFFRTERYSDYGVPMFQVEHHYFSSYD